MGFLGLENNAPGLIAQFGGLGVFLAMFLESSFLPLPSELIIIGASAIGVPLGITLLFGSLGSICGAVLGYALGRFTLVKPQRIQKAEEFTRKYGIAGIFIGRVISLVPFKFFSIAAGLTRAPFVPFLLSVVIGIWPRVLVLAVFGAVIVKQNKVVLVLIIFAALIFLVFKIMSLIYRRREAKIRGGTR